MREEDLRTLLAARAADSPDCPDRSAGVQRKVARIRRRRVAGVVSGLAVLALVALAGRPIADRVIGSPAARQPASVGAFPEYHEGGKLIGSGALRLPATEARFQVTPGSDQLIFGYDCQPIERVLPIDFAVLVNRHQIMEVSGGCSGSSLPDSDLALYPAALRSWGVTPGRPFTITIRLTEHRADAGPGAVVIGVWQMLPLEQYPLPPRPPGPIPPPLAHPGQPDAFTSELFSVLPTPQQPNTTVTRTVLLTADLGASMRCVAPGALTIRLDDRVMGTATCWDYLGKDVSKIGFVAPDLDPVTARKVGHRVRLTITAERFTDPAWRVVVGHLR